MITTVTLNPAVDFSIITDKVFLGQVQVINEGTETVGGKGINVSKVLNLFGVDNVATGILGKKNSHVFFDFFEESKMRQDFVLVDGKTRTNIKINETAENRTTDLNAQGFFVDDADKAMIKSKIKKHAKVSDFVVMSGSLPLGCGDDFYAQIVRDIKNDTTVVVDVDNEKLRLCVEAGAHIIKPNINELETAFGQTFESDEECVVFCQELINEHDLRLVLLTLGQRGAVMISESGAVYSKQVKISALNTVGAGDSLLGGFLSGVDRGLSDIDAFKMGVACGTCAVMTKDTAVFGLNEFEGMVKRVELMGE